MSRVTEAALRANGGVIVTDPITDRQRPAGSYDPYEWGILRQSNPDLTQALIESRAARKDAMNAREGGRDAITFAGGTLAATGLAATVGQARVNNWLHDVLTRQQSTLVPKDMAIYGSNSAWMTVPEPGVVEFDAIADLDERRKLEEALRAKQAFRELRDSDAGQFLYKAVPYDADPVRLDQKRAIFERMGFKPGLGVFQTQSPDGSTGMRLGEVHRLDQRPGARQFKHLYAMGDTAADVAGLAPKTTARALRYGGAGIAALALATAGRGIWDMVNPIREEK